MISTIRALTAGLYGSAIGDALGQPAQFNSFADQQTHPVTEMAVGVYDTRPGT
ncbi:hypothetical protein ACRYI5_08720 [Furfurilactobacillus sp. WILCCON 0119]